MAHEEDEKATNPIPTPKHIVLSFGKNDKLQTAHNWNSNVSEPQIVNFSANTQDTDLVYIAAGFDHSGAIDQNGNVILWGDNTQHQISNRKSKYLLPQHLTFRSSVVSMALSGSNSLFLDEHGTVWNMGSNTKLSPIQFPFRHKSRNSGNSNSAKKQKSNECITSIHCGYRHFGAISNLNRLYLWGNNQYGQCGVKKMKNVTKPKLMDFR